jgi:DNA-binding MarR family transcriptional regulator
MSADLRQELHQGRPFRSLQQEAQLNVIRTAALLLDRFELMLKPAGITGAQYNVLRILQGAEPDGLCRNEIRERMITRMPDMTRLLDRMEDAGLVARARESQDRRMVNTRLTAKGRRLLQDLQPQVDAEHQRRFGHLSDDESRRLIALLTSVRQHA